MEIDVIRNKLTPVLTLVEMVEYSIKNGLSTNCTHCNRNPDQDLECDLPFFDQLTPSTNGYCEYHKYGPEV
jgi:hypothetical protein